MNATSAALLDRLSGSLPFRSPEATARVISAEAAAPLASGDLVLLEPAAQLRRAA